MAATPDSIRALAKSAPMDDIKARTEIYQAARELMFAVEPTLETDNRIYFACMQLSITQIANDLKLFETLAADTKKEWSVDELAEKTGADPILLHRLLRYLAAIALISEPAASTYKASHITPHLRSSGFVAGLKHNATLTNPPFVALPTVLRENNYQNLVGSKTCAFQRGLNTEGDIMDYLTTHPETAQAAFTYMETHKATSPTWMDGSVPVSDFQLSDADLSAGRVMAVDVGGGAGHQMLALRTAFPELKGRMVVQDVAVMIDQVDGAVAEASGLEPMVHDFFTAQPVKGAKVYYLRNVLHDWGDEQCKEILVQLREAMATDSVVVLDEIVLPAQGASVGQMHFDLTMMASVGSMERSEKQWRERLGAVGLAIRDVWIYDRGLSTGLIVAVLA